MSNIQKMLVDGHKVYLSGTAGTRSEIWFPIHTASNSVMNSEEAAQRAAACWNACEGVPDVALKTGIVAEMGVEVQQLLQKVEHFQQLAEHRGRSIDNLLNTQGRMSTLNDQLLAAVERAFASLDQTDSSGDVGKWISEPVEILRAAIAAAKGGAA